ncbi:MAG: hypothetical protein LBI42_01655 [Chitinispirillales bacterium]|jgi:TolB protein|nr:hypothetical protein [Chitinispirillales bacterium]
MKRFLLLLSGFVFVTNSFAAEKFNLEVYASRFDSIPIGVVDFKSTNRLTINENIPWEIIANNLDFCGKFNVVKSPTFDSALFVSKDAGIYIDGEYTVTGSNIVITCNLRDVAARSLIISKKYQGDLKYIRSMVHRYSNELVEMLFGDRGIFESRVLFVKVEGTRKNIAIMDFDGFNQLKLTNNNTVNIFPTFADKSTVLWSSYQRGKPDIYKASIKDGSSKIFISGRTLQVSPNVSPIDGTVAYASSQAGKLDVYTCNADGANVRRLTFSSGIDTSPGWSPNGYQITFTSDRAGGPQIYVMDADGANQRRITFEGRYNDSPAWSPKGDRIAYASMAQGYRFNIWTVSPDGTNPKMVVSLPGSSENPTWAPDGSLIAFTNTQNGKSDLYVVRPDGTRLRKVTSSGDVRMPNWDKFW